MIRIKKPARVPAILRKRGTATKKRLCKLYDSDPEAYKSGETSFTFDSHIYGHRTVKDALRTAQHVNVPSASRR